jgi:hypothetical protein
MYTYIKPNEIVPAKKFKIVFIKSYSIGYVYNLPTHNAHTSIDPSDVFRRNDSYTRSILYICVALKIRNAHEFKTVPIIYDCGKSYYRVVFASNYNIKYCNLYNPR